MEAPATLPEGYTFDAQFNGQTFSVKVPVGGVKEGQKFIVPFPAVTDGSSASAILHSSGPVGYWKDGLCDCCRFGCNSVCWNAWCCQLILLGQIMTRLKLTWLANDGTTAQTTRTFRIMLIITIGWISWSVIQSLLQSGTSPVNQYSELSNAYLYSLWAGQAARLIFMVFWVYVVSRTRYRIRQMYSIPGGGCDDCCCSFWCPCCTISQMARHTAEYEKYAGQCCSETGLPPHAPALDGRMSPLPSSIV